MSDFFLDNICKYLKEQKITVEFKSKPCIESDIYSMIVYNGDNGVSLGEFDIRKGDMKIIQLISKLEGFESNINI